MMSILKDLKLLLIKVAAIAFVFFLLFTFLFGLARYQEPAMDPAIKDGDLVVFYRFTASGYYPGDPVVLNRDGKTEIRRVVAMPGDTVDITQDGLVINGSLQYEFGIYERTERYVEGVDFPYYVPENSVFVLGDCRTAAVDSRIYGAVGLKEIKGKVITVIRRRGI